MSWKKMFQIKNSIFEVSKKKVDTAYAAMGISSEETDFQIFP